MRTAITEVQIKVRGLSLPTYSESDSFHEVCMGSSEARGLTCHRPTDIDRDMQSCTSLKERGPSGVQRLTCDSGYLLDHQARCRTAMPWPETSVHCSAGMYETSPATQEWQLDRRTRRQQRQLESVLQRRAAMAIVEPRSEAPTPTAAAACGCACRTATPVSRAKSRTCLHCKCIEVSGHGIAVRHRA